MKLVPVVLASLLTLSCAAFNAQKSAPDPSATRKVDQAKAIVPAGHATLDKEPLAIKQAILVSEIDKYIDDLKANGKYDCCVKPSCRQCAINAGECHCRQVIDKNGPCCGECTQSWVEGRGNTAGVDREAVLKHLGCIRELYDKPTPEGVETPGQSKKE